MISDTLIEVNNLSINYPSRQVIKGIHLSLHEKTTYALLGPSGCGKTTLLYALADLLPEVCHVEGSCKTRQELKLSTVLQDFGLFPWKTVLENTLLPLIIQGPKTAKLSDESKKRALDILDMLNLEEHLNHYPSALSGGQKQRVAIARAWLTSPDLLLLDEPFSSLDALTRESLQDTLLDLYRKTEMSMFTVTHSIEEAVYLGKKVFIMDHYGQIITQLDNLSFGSPNARESDNYFKQVLIIRKILKELRYEKTSMDL